MCAIELPHINLSTYNTIFEILIPHQQNDILFHFIVVAIHHKFCDPILTQGNCMNKEVTYSRKQAYCTYERSVIKSQLNWVPLTIILRYMGPKEVIFCSN